MRGNGNAMGEVEVYAPDEAQDLRGQPAALMALTRAEIDGQIATAKRFPRSPEKFLKDARSMVSVDPELAAQCTYILPARKGGDGRAISGPSVRLAEIVAACWGNLRIAGRIVEDDGRMVTAQGVAIDLERNVGYSLEVKRRVTTRDGRRFGDDMIGVTCNAAIAIVTRNVTFKAVPRAFVNLVHDQAQLVARGDEKSLPERTGKALAWFASKGVKDAEVFAALGIAGPAEMSLETLTTLQGYRASIHEGHATVEAIFRPQSEPAVDQRKGVEGLAERMKPTPAPKPDDDEPSPASLEG